MKRITRRRYSLGRSGLIAPAVAFALLVVMGCVALVLDQLWLDVADSEMATLSEATALNAGRALISDDLLRNEADGHERIEKARRAAKIAAAHNLVAGESVPFDVSPGGDLRFGRLVRESSSGRIRFLETDHHPTSVLVTAQRTRLRGNPVAMAINHLGGVNEADVVSRCEVSIDNRIVGLRPYSGTPVPAFPISILKCDPSGTRTDTWDHQIGQGNGPDEFTYLAESGRVIPGGDGIPEIHIRSKAISDDDDEKGNMHLIDLNTGLRGNSLAKQIARGWSKESLRRFGGELRFGEEGLQFISSDTIVSVIGNAFAEQLGKCRICLLYDQHQEIGKTGLGEVRCVGIVAGRVMHISPQDNGAYEIVFQPGVLSTKTAVLSHESDRETADANRYIYKLQLTQ